MNCGRAPTTVTIFMLRSETGLSFPRPRDFVEHLFAAHFVPIEAFEGRPELFRLGLLAGFAQGGSPIEDRANRGPAFLPFAVLLRLLQAFVGPADPFAFL